MYTVTEAARIVDVPASTLAAWAKGYIKRFPERPAVTGQPVIAYRPADSPRMPTVPFVGLVEALVLAAVRRSGVSMQRIRPALAQLQQELGIEHALASRKLYTDGAELLFDFGERQPDTSEGRSALQLVVVRNGQRVFTEVIQEYLQRITYAEDGYPQLIRVPAYPNASVVADPTRAFGSPIFERGGARVTDVLERFWAGESIEEIAPEFGVPVDELEDVLRATSRRAA